MAVIDPSQTPLPHGAYTGGDTVNTGGDWWTQNAPSVRTGVATPQGAASAADPNAWNGIDPRLAQLYQQHGITTPGARGSGFQDAAYWNDLINKTGDWGYVSGRLGSDLSGSGPDAPTGSSYGGNGGSLSNLAPQDLSTGWTQPFTAPTADEAMNSPGIQAALKMGSQAIQRSAAAKGTLLTGGTLKDLTSFANDLGSQAYGDVWNRAMAERQNAQQTFFGNQDRLFGRNLSLAELGSGAAGAGGNLITGAGNATAAGQVGSANANIGALSGIANAAGSVASQMLPQNNSSYTVSLPGVPQSSYKIPNVMY